MIHKDSFTGTLKKMVSIYKGEFLVFFLVSDNLNCEYIKNGKYRDDLDQKVLEKQNDILCFLIFYLEDLLL